MPWDPSKQRPSFGHVVTMTKNRQQSCGGCERPCGCFSSPTTQEPVGVTSPPFPSAAVPRDLYTQDLTGVGWVILSGRLARCSRELITSQRSWSQGPFLFSLVLLSLLSVFQHEHWRLFWDKAQAACRHGYLWGWVTLCSLPLAFPSALPLPLPHVLLFSETWNYQK